ncbi:MAG: hypothetical protein EAZ27_06065, partial [Cytophagales bacterium]
DVVTIKCISLKVMNLMPFVFFTNVHIILYQLLRGLLYSLAQRLSNFKTAGPIAQNQSFLGG